MVRIDIGKFGPVSVQEALKGDFASSNDRKSAEAVVRDVGPLFEEAG